MTKGRHAFRLRTPLIALSLALPILLWVCRSESRPAGAAEAEKPKETPVAREARVRKEAEGFLEKMRKDLGKTFRYRVVRCFAVAGDVDARRFHHLCERTLGAGYDAYQKQFFEKTPEHACRVFLFGNRTSYLSHCKKLFGSKPSTPFGYYSHQHRALVMNIGTGGGTLVHEMFHALVEPDFPDIPAWANEGIASLFEQWRITCDKLIGLTNWRLAGLQKAIEKGTCPSLRKVMGSGDAAFRADSGLNYAVARYFMLHLQQEGLLEKCYKTFRDRYNEDKTGITFAEELLGKKLEEFEPGWRKWVKGLRFRQ